MPCLLSNAHNAAHIECATAKGPNRTNPLLCVSKQIARFARADYANIDPNIFAAHLEG